MTYFVVVYDRPRGHLVNEPERFPVTARSAAMERRFALERQYVRETDYEIVVLAGESEEAIRRTHGRYFKSMDELLAAGEAAG